MVYNGLLDYRQQYVPGKEEWRPVPRDPQRFPRPERVSPEEAEGVRRIGEWFDQQLAGSGAVTDEALAEVEQQFAALGIVADAQGVRGQPVVPNAEYCTDEESRGWRRRRAAPIDAPDCAAVPPRRETRGARLAERFVALSDHLADQGLVAGSGFAWGWYAGRSSPMPTT